MRVFSFSVSFLSTKYGYHSNVSAYTKTACALKRIELCRISLDICALGVITRGEHFSTFSACPENNAAHDLSDPIHCDTGSRSINFARRTRERMRWRRIEGLIKLGALAVLALSHSLQARDGGYLKYLYL